MSKQLKKSTRSNEDQVEHVIIEMRMPRDQQFSMTPNIQDGLNIPSLRMDENYKPVPSNPEETNLSFSRDLEANREKIVIMRGTINKEDIEKLKKYDKVVNVYKDTPIAPFLQKKKKGNTESQASSSNDCESSISKGTLQEVVKYLKADQLWAKGIKGNNIVVGIVDGGTTAKGRTNLGEIPNIIGGWPENWGKEANWNGHGNMVAYDVLGIAPEASIYDYRVASGSIREVISNAIAIYGHAIESFKETGKPQILTNSWGIYEEEWDRDYARNPNHPFTKKVVEAINLGIIVLFAAGNCGEACADSRCSSDVGPGKSIWGANGHPNVITVGAANINEQYIGYSSQGPAALSPYKPDFCAISHFKGYFKVDTGTSAACPIAAGVIALLKQAQPTLNQFRAKEILKMTAKDLGPYGWDPKTGSGIIQAELAYNMLQPASTLS